MMSIAAARQIIEASVKPVFVVFDEKAGKFFTGIADTHNQLAKIHWSATYRLILETVEEAQAKVDWIAALEGVRRPEVLILPVLP